MSVVSVVCLKERSLLRADHSSRGVLMSVGCPMSVIAKHHKGVAMTRNLVEEQRGEGVGLVKEF